MATVRYGEVVSGGEARELRSFEERLKQRKSIAPPAPAADNTELTADETGNDTAKKTK